MSIYKNLDSCIISELSIISKNDEALREYFNLVNDNMGNNLPKDIITEKHHILPKSLFPLYKSLARNPWNKVNLSLWDHLHAHRLLSIITEEKSLIWAYIAMSGKKKYNNYNNIDDKNEYYNLKNLIVSNCSHTKGMVSVIDDVGNSFYVPVNHPDYISGKLKHHLTGRVHMKDKDNIVHTVYVDDPRILSGELTSLMSGRVLSKNIQSGEIVSVLSNDPRFLSGELVGIAKHTVVVENIDGDKFQVSNNDSRFLSGELKSIHKGKITVKNSLTDEILSVSVKDGRYLSGELVPISIDKIVVYDPLTGKNKQIDKNDPKYISGELKSIHKGKITVEDCNGNIFKVSKNDKRIKTGELVYKSFSKGKITVKDPLTNKTMQIDKDDPRVLSGEFVSVIKGLVTGIDKNGIYHHVNKNDERFNTGELVHPLKGRVTVKDKFGNTISIFKNDPRYISGEFIPIRCGKKLYNNGEIENYYYPNDVPSGYIKGSLNYNSKMATNTGKKVYNNGIKNKFFKNTDIIPPEYKMGRIK